MAQYVKKYNTFDVADGSGLILRLSVCMNLCFLFATVIGHCDYYTRALPRQMVSGQYLALNPVTASSSAKAYLCDVKGTLCDVRYIIKRR